MTIMMVFYCYRKSASLAYERVPPAVTFTFGREMRCKMLVVFATLEFVLRRLVHNILLKYFLSFELFWFEVLVAPASF